MPAVAEAPSASISEAAGQAAVMGGRTSSPGLVGKNMETAFAGFDKIVKPPAVEPNIVPPAPAQKKTEEPPPKPKAEEKEEAPPEQPADEKAETTTEPEKPAAQQQPPKPKKPADFLRDELAKTKSERDTLKAEIEKIKSTPPDDTELKSLRERLEAAEKSKADYESELRYTRYEKSAEYREKYQQPFEQAWQEGRNWVAKLKMTGEDGTVRQATPADFDRIVETAFSDPEKAVELMESLFGPTKAATISPYIARVQEFSRLATQAIENYRTKGSEREKQFAEGQKKLNEELGTAWKSALDPKNVPEKFRKWVLPKGNDEKGQPIDKEWDNLLAKGLEEFDRASQDNSRDLSLSKEQRLAILNRAAAIRNKAAAFHPLRTLVERQEKQIAELTKELEAYKASEPGPGEGTQTGSGKSAQDGTMAGAMAALEKKSTPVFY